jgi:glutamate synthase (NADPH/NADH) small chain
LTPSLFGNAEPQQRRFPCSASAAGRFRRGNVKADVVSYRSSHPKIFACGDMRRGQSLVVWAIPEGRQAAHAVDKALMGATMLPR